MDLENRESRCKLVVVIVSCVCVCVCVCSRRILYHLAFVARRMKGKGCFRQVS